MTLKPRVAVIATGGTISALGLHSLDYYDYGSAGRFMSGEELVGRLTELRLVADIVPLPYGNGSSSAIGPVQWCALATMIDMAAAGDSSLAGFVLTHGTSSLEETAYFLSLAIRTDKPVVVVGAQRPPSSLGSDAEWNLLNAVRVAACEQSRGMGVLVVLNGEINAAREATKTSTYGSHSFRSPDLGLLGYADGDAVRFYRRPVRRYAPNTEFDIAGLSDLPRVDIVMAYGGADGSLVDAAVDSGARGIVSAGLPPGVVPPEQRAAFLRASERGVVVVQSSRASSGRVTAARSVISRSGMIAADTLSPQKARILLMLALTRFANSADIERAFAIY
jgi:L-asparaginase